MSGMTIRFSPRTASSWCALSVICALALPAHPAASDTGSGPGAPRPAASLLYASGTQVQPRSGAPALPDVSALSWVVGDATTGEVLAAHDAHRALPPASTLKTLFALTVLPVLPADTRHTVTNRELQGIGAGSSLVGVQEGHTYQVSDLWRGVFLNSGNDAVHVLAAINGGVPSTVRQMQAKAHELGALDTHVVSPDGYDADGQVSSAYDLAVFGRAGLQNADFRRYCGTVESRFPANGAASFEIANTNRLLTGRDGVAAYPGLIGIKNGYTTNAGNTLVAAARHGGRTLIVTVMNPQRHRGHDVYEEARSLLDWGFTAAGRVTPVGSLLPERPAVSRSGPTAVPTAAAAAPDWPARAVLAGTVGLAVGAVVALALWLRGRRSARG